MQNRETGPLLCISFLNPSSSHCSEVRSVVFNFLQPLRLQPARFLCPWNSPRKNTGVGCHSLLQGDLPDPGTDLRSSALQADSLPSEPPGKPTVTSFFCILCEIYKSVARGHQRADALKPYTQKTSQSNHTRTTALSNSMKLSHALWGRPRRVGMLKRSDRM